MSKWTSDEYGHKRVIGVFLLDIWGTGNGLFEVWISIEEDGDSTVLPTGATSYATLAGAKRAAERLLRTFLKQHLDLMD